MSPASLEQLLRRQLKTQSLDQLRTATNRMDTADDLPYMSPDKVAEEIAAMRAERRASDKG